MRDLVESLFKVMSVYFAAIFASKVSMLYTIIVHATDIDTNSGTYAAIAGLLAPIVSLAIAVVLWVFSDKLANVVTENRELPLVSLKREELVKSLLSVAGIMLIIYSAARLPGHIHFYHGLREMVTDFNDIPVSLSLQFNEWVSRTTTDILRIVFSIIIIGFSDKIAGIKTEQ